MAPKTREAVKPKKGSGLRRRFSGKMILKGGSPRGHSSTKSRASITYEHGQTRVIETKGVNGQFKTNMPKNKAKHSRPVHPISESGEWWPILSDN